MILLDTHVLVWWLSEPRRLSRRATRAINANAAINEVAISTVSLFEIATLLRRKRLELVVEEKAWFTAVCSLPELTIEPISAQIAWAAGNFDDALPGDPADRMIVATAKALDVDLISADERLRSIQVVRTIW